MGGKAFATKTRRINRDEVDGTLEWLEDVWPDRELNLETRLRDCLLGSTGKSATSGDIDLNLEITAYDQDKVANQLINLLGADNVKARPGNNQIFTSVPIMGDGEKHGYVQVDFMFGDFDWQKFSYFSAAYQDTMPQYGQRNVTSFKGLFRTEFIKSLVAFNSDWTLMEGDQMVARVGPTFFHDRGIVWRYRHRPFKKGSTTERVKELKELTAEEFREVYPSSLSASNIILTDPRKMSEWLFGYDLGVTELETIERLAMYVRRYYSTEQINQVIEIFKERLNNLKVIIPTEKFARIYMKV